MKGFLNLSIKTLISLILIGYVLGKVNVGSIINSIKSANFLLLVAAFTLHFIGLYLSAYRWQLLLKAQGTNISLLTLSNIYLVGFFFNIFLPSSVGGDIVRAYDTGKLSKSHIRSAMVIIIERLTGIIGLLLIATIAFWAGKEEIRQLYSLKIVILIFVFSMIVFIFLLFYPALIENIVEKFRKFIPGKINSKIGEILNIVKIYADRKNTLYITLILAFLLQVNVIIHYYLLSLSIGMNISGPFLFLTVPIIMVVLMLPVSINGIGLRENIHIYFFSTLGGASVADAVALAWIYLGMVLIFGIIGGLIYILRRK